MRPQVYLIFFGTLVSVAASPNEFDYFLLVRNWAPTDCENFECDSSVAGSNFTIHGLWPEYENQTWPSFCNASATFNIDLLADLLPELKEQWPRLFTSPSNDEFWRHEWMKHGTCSGLRQRMYFEQTLKLDKKYNLLAVLEAGQIVPSDSTFYKFDDVVAAFKKGLGVDTDVRTDGDSLSEVRMCLSRQFEPFDCPTVPRPKSSPDNIRLPTRKGKSSNGSGSKNARHQWRESLAIVVPVVLLVLLVAVLTRMTAEGRLRQQRRTRVGVMWTIDEISLEGGSSTYDQNVDVF